MRSVRKVWLHAWLLAVVLPCSGCFQASTVISVQADGRGTIKQRVVYTAASLAQIRQFSALAGGGSQNFDPLSEQQARDAADSMGLGVTYVSSTPIDTAEGQGRDITYAFTDVNQLRFDAQPPTPGGLMGGAQIGTATRATFSLMRQPNALAILRVTVPQLSLAGGRRIGPAGSLPSTEEIGLVRSLIAGARLAIVIEPAGQLVRTTSPFVDGPRVSLIDIDFDQFLRDDTLRLLRGARTADEAKAVLKDVPGVKINFEPEITIEFR